MTSEQDREAEIREEADSATRGPWRVEYGPVSVLRNVALRNAWGSLLATFPSGYQESDCDFIAHSRENVPWLLEQLDVARTRNQSVLEAFRGFTQLVSTFSSDPQMVESAGRIREAIDAKSERLVRGRGMSEA